MGSDGVLFIDSSHEVRAGNDVVSLILKIIPTLSKGVVIHFHDIYLPYEYPRDLMLEHRWSRDWNEQYILQAMLQGSNQFEVLWPGNYLEQTLPGFSKHFAHKASRPGSFVLDAENRVTLKSYPQRATQRVSRLTGAATMPSCTSAVPSAKSEDQTRILPFSFTSTMSSTMFLSLTIASRSDSLSAPMGFASRML